MGNMEYFNIIGIIETTYNNHIIWKRILGNKRKTL
jgi:hypothetical protein